MRVQTGHSGGDRGGFPSHYKSVIASLSVDNQSVNQPPFASRFVEEASIAYKGHGGQCSTCSAENRRVLVFYLVSLGHETPQQGGDEDMRTAKKQTSMKGKGN